MGTVKHRKDVAEQLFTVIEGLLYHKTISYCYRNHIY